MEHHQINDDYNNHSELTSPHPRGNKYFLNQITSMGLVALE